MRMCQNEKTHPLFFVAPPDAPAGKAFETLPQSTYTTFHPRLLIKKLLNE